MPVETERAFAHTQATAIAALLNLLHACAMQDSSSPPARIQHRILHLLECLRGRGDALDPLGPTLEELAEAWQARLEAAHAGVRT